MKKTWMKLVLACLLTLGVSASHIDTAAAGTGEDEAQFIVLVNQLRSGLGLQPLTPHPDLHGGAVTWTAVLANNGELSHAPDLSTGVTVNWAKLGENVGVASVGQTKQLFDAFVASPTHYANLVDPDFTYIGVAVRYDDTGRMWTTHRFMKVFETATTQPPPATAPPATTAPPTTTKPTAAPTTSVAPNKPVATTTTIAEAQVTTTSAAPADATQALTTQTPASLDSEFVVAVVEQLAVAGI